MIRKLAFKLVACWALLSSVAAPAASEPTPLKPTSKWMVDYAENLCVLSRSFGSKEQPVILGFKPSPMAESIRLLLIVDSAQSVPSSGTGSVQSGNEGEPTGTYFASRYDADKSRRLIFMDVNRADLKGVEQSELLKISAGKKFDLSFALGAAAAAFRSLNACEMDLLKSWGMSEAALASIVEPPKAEKNLAAYVSDSDYPSGAIASGQQGTSGFRLLIDVNGSVRECNIVEPSGSPLLDQVSCQVMLKRARYRPARDREGRPVASLTFARITWRIPE
jgi:TonB family protein